MAAETSRVVTEEQEELAASGATHRTQTRSQSHIQFQPVTHAAQWQAPRALAHTRSHSHTHFNTPSHVQSQKYGCRLTHSLSAMTKGEKRAQRSVGPLIKPSDPLFPKTPQQVRSPVVFLRLPPYRSALSHSFNPRACKSAISVSSHLLHLLC